MTPPTPPSPNAAAPGETPPGSSLPPWLRQAGSNTVARLRQFVGHRSGHIDFRELINRENGRLDQGQSGHSVVAPGGISGEPWVRVTENDRLGLALSGGGIRSATFNLGLLQALKRRSLLKEIHYLATVSGGGYVGGFWTAWLQRQSNAGIAGADFPEPPSATAPGSSNAPEPAPIRHLREFSRFLMPRLGFFQSETWDGIVAILGGLLPALLTANALIALAFYVWFLAAFELMVFPVNYTALVVGGLTFAIHVAAEHVWFSSTRRGQAVESLRGSVGLAVCASVAAAFAWRFIAAGHVNAAPAWLGGVILPFLAPLGGAAAHAGFCWQPFALSVTWLLLGVVMLFVRAGFAVLFAVLGETAAASLSRKLERAASRFFAAALIWAGFALLWEIGRWLAGSRPYVATGAGAVTAVCSALFVWVRDWLGKPPEETNATQLLKRAAAVLKPLAPQLLADAVVVLLFVVVCLLVQSFGLGSGLGMVAYGFGGAAAIVLLTFLLFTPARVGLHDFYRSRISRCYLGAAAAQEFPDYRRPTVEQPDDDFTLGALVARPGYARPIHLVCCTANNLSGDPLGSLYRGGRSVTVSPFGLTLGDLCAPMDNLRLSSVLTASAAAFNSQMGSISMRLGPAVSFLMCAFNLRLGLWVAHPRNPLEKPFPPGLPYFYEMFGRTNCDPEPPPPIPAAGAAAGPVEKAERMVEDWIDRTSRFTHMLHLSDGGHFENLALYELVRRHCRYIIASDSGADPQSAFDDLANALRRIREDFGVEIELDTSPLRPDADGLARQHAIIGTIHYDGFGGTDKGTLIYLKPVLTGDEPADVLGYRQRNGTFPHESTGDQFYDEPQWESYRRLGEHAGSIVFQYVEELAPARRSGLRFVESVFFDATDRWYPAPSRENEIFADLNARCSDLDAAVRDSAPAALRAELFPEVGATGIPAKAHAATPDDDVRILFFCIQAAQILEDVWRAAELATKWSHPVNEGWMNYFRRWAATPSFRRWWPLLRPLYSAGLRNFVRERFEIVVRDPRARSEPLVPGAELTLTPLAIDDEKLAGFAWTQWAARRATAEPARLAAAGYQVLDYRLSLAPARDGSRGQPIQVGFLLYRFTDTAAGRCAEWTSHELFVPPPMVGAGITARLLDAVVRHFSTLAEGRPRELRVTMDDQPAGIQRDGPGWQVTDPGSRLQSVRDIGFYRSRGFSQVVAAPDGTPAKVLRLVLPR